MISYQSILDKLGLDTLPCPIKYTNQNLRFFELGAFFETQDECWIEINPKIKSSLFGYSLEIIVMHEIIHAIRKDFEDSYFEELIAYHICKRNYQRFLGPFFSKKMNQILILILPLAVLFSHVMNIWCVLFLICFLRHVYEFSLFKSALKYLKNQFSQDCESFGELLKLDKNQLIKLAKKSATSVRDL